MCMALDINWEKKYESEEQLRESLEQIRDSLEEAVASELDAVWQKIKDLAVELCPKESGALASSIELGSESGRLTVSQGNEFYSNSISAGNDSTFNREGQPTSQYAVPVHDGHLLPNGMFWEGTPFLTDAIDQYESELQSAIDRALSDIIGD